LAKCGKERGQLEAELASIVVKLKSSAGSTHRRRRRSRSSLVQIQEHDAVDAEADHDALKGDDDEDMEEPWDSSLLETRRAAIKQRLSELEKEAGVAEDAIQQAMDKAAKSSGDIAKLDALAEALLEKIAGLDKNEAMQAIKLEKAEAENQQAVKLLEMLEKKVASVTDSLDKADEKMGAAESELAAQTSTQLQVQTSLIVLVQKTQHLRHEALHLAHAEAGKKLGQSQVLLDEKEALLKKDHEEECDELRGKVVSAKAKLGAAAEALKNCLQAKKDIQKKIDAVEKMRDAAKQALDQCLATKAKLKQAVDECHMRRDSARKKLQECLDRKKDLKIKIAACHDKRDEARAKLAECLKNKKALAEKIQKAKASAAKRSSLIEAASSQSPDANVENNGNNNGENNDENDDDGMSLEDLEGMLAALKLANANFDENAQAYIEEGKLVQAALAEIQVTSGEEKAVMQQLKDAAKLETQNQIQVMKLQTALQDAYEDLKAIDRQSDSAKAQSEAVGGIADEVSSSLSALLQRL